MQPNTRKLLTDALEACRVIEDWMAGVDLASYESDLYRQSAVQYQLFVIGEALRRLERVGAPEAGEISELRGIIGLRNRIAHGYDDIDHELVFEIVASRVPALKGDLERLLGID